VPIEVVGHITLVQAAVNGAVRAMLIVDTGASTTLITPLLMARLGQPIPPHAPRREVSVGGGQTLQVPFVTIGVLQVGDARVDGIEVGVYDAFPEAPELDGWLGTDFLHRFRVTLDKKARRMTLAPLPR
jgi:predicted aspartyl protease